MGRIKNWKLVRKTPKKWTKNVISLKEWKNKKTGEYAEIRKYKDGGVFTVTKRNSMVASSKYDGEKYLRKYMKRNTGGK